MIGPNAPDSPGATASSAAEAVLQLAFAARRSGWRGADPFDGLWWPWTGALTGGKRRRQVIVQLHARSRFDIRRIHRRPYSLISKTLALFGAASVRLWQLTEDRRFCELALDSLEILAADRSAGQAAWGYPWDTQTRWSFYPAATPNIVATSFAAHALLDAAESLDRTDFGARAQMAGEWVREALWSDSAKGFVYHAGSDVLVHNANLLGASLVRRVFPHDLTPDLAVTTSLRAQRPDGSWPYGSGPSNLAFVDSFHTGYVLSCLLPFGHRADVATALERGARYYTSQFFESRGRALLWPGRRYPEDGHSAGTAMTTIAQLCQCGLAEQDLLERVTARVLTRSLRRGHVVHRRGRFLRSTVRYVRWCDGHVALGLSHAAAMLAPQSMASTAPTVSGGLSRDETGATVRAAKVPL